MSAFLRRLWAAPATRELLRLVFAALAGALSSGCGLIEARNPDFDVFECQVEAFADAIPRAAAEDLAMAARSVNVEYVVKQLLRLGLVEGRIQAVAEAYQACAAEPALMDEPTPAPAYSIDA